MLVSLLGYCSLNVTRRSIQPNSNVKLFLGHKSNVNALTSMEPDGYFASVSTDISVRIWDSGSGKLVGTMQVRAPVKARAGRVTLGGDLFALIRVTGTTTMPVTSDSKRTLVAVGIVTLQSGRYHLS